MAIETLAFQRFFPEVLPAVVDDIYTEYKDLVELTWRHSQQKTLAQFMAHLYRYWTNHHEVDHIEAVLMQHKLVNTLVKRSMRLRGNKE